MWSSKYVLLLAAIGMLEMTVEYWEKQTTAAPEPALNGAKMREALVAPLCCFKWEVEASVEGHVKVFPMEFRMQIVSSRLP
jgi:hypothetical protein